MESCVANPINTLIKLFVLPSNLVSKRHDKLLDYDSAQSVYEKAKDQQARQVWVPIPRRSRQHSHEFLSPL